MKFEYLAIGFLPVLVGYVGERYKNMNTLLYGVFATFIVFLYYLSSAIDSGNFTLRMDLIPIYIGIIFVVTALFHLFKILANRKK